MNSFVKVQVPPRVSSAFYELNQAHHFYTVVYSVTRIVPDVNGELRLLAAYESLSTAYSGLLNDHSHEYYQGAIASAAENLLLVDSVRPPNLALGVNGRLPAEAKHYAETACILLACRLCAAIRQLDAFQAGVECYVKLDAPVRRVLPVMTAPVVGNLESIDQVQIQVESAMAKFPKDSRSETASAEEIVPTVEPELTAAIDDAAAARTTAVEAPATSWTISGAFAAVGGWIWDMLGQVMSLLSLLPKVVSPGSWSSGSSSFGAANGSNNTPFCLDVCY